MALPTIYVDTGGATTNSGSSDSNAADLTGTAATVAASVVSLDGSPDLSGVAADGSATIAIADATNSNQKIFKITAVDNTAKTVTVSVAPTGVVSSAWAIGGRLLLNDTSLAYIAGAMDAGWIMQINNSPAAFTSSMQIPNGRNGDQTTGRIIIRGKSGVRPVISCSASTFGLGNGNNFSLYENLEVAETHVSANGVYLSGLGVWAQNIVVSDAGGIGVKADDSNCMLWDSGISGANHGVSWSGSTCYAGMCFGNYIHDNTTDGIQCSGPAETRFKFNIIDSNGGRGFNVTGSSTNAIWTLTLINNTVYANGDSGLEVDNALRTVILMNNLFQDNGNAAGEYNVEWTTGSIELIGWHDYNLFYHAGGGGGANLSGLTATANELTSDPQMTDPANGDFSLGSASPAIGAGMPTTFRGSATTSNINIGAAQSAPGGGGGGMRLAGHGGLAA